MYYQFWRGLSEEEHLEYLCIIYLMGCIMCYDALDTSGGRFPWALMGVLHQMITLRMTFA